MAKNGFKILDSDMHVMEPPDLWERYIDGKFKARAPRGVTSSNVRDLRMVYPDGRDWARTTTRQNDSARGHNFERNQEIYRSDAARGWTPEVQLEAMDIEGIDVAVLYPTRGLRALVVEDMDAEFAAAIARAYNNWLYDFSSINPNRLIGAGMISPYDMNDAVTEAQRSAAELGFRAVFLRANPLVKHQWHDPYYEPLWSALEDLNISLGFHESTGTGKRQIGERLEPNLMLRRVYAQPMEQMLALGDFCAAGVLARHPKLRVVSRGELQLVAVAFVASGRRLGTRRRCLGAGSEWRRANISPGSAQFQWNRMKRLSNRSSSSWMADRLFFPQTIRTATPSIREPSTTF